jgi:hypothetical protein
MSAKIRVQYGKVWLEVDAESPKDAIKQLSAYSGASRVPSVVTIHGAPFPTKGTLSAA